MSGHIAASAVFFMIYSFREAVEFENEEVFEKPGVTGKYIPPRRHQDENEKSNFKMQIAKW
ncbi:MAG: hypothetical protein A2Z46_06255 [Nitrospirae bacterium RBG_19FT_COMBO_55_12]|nr:MAG: hypothetical protein A2Z46_06255 [Nitrospirae bacterium RBG_19FT_COMBO_55_12]